MAFQERVDSDVGLGHRGASVLEPEPRGGVLASPEMGPRDVAGLPRGVADGTMRRGLRSRGDEGMSAGDGVFRSEYPQCHL